MFKLTNKGKNILKLKFFIVLFRLLEKLFLKLSTDDKIDGVYAPAFLTKLID